MVHALFSLALLPDRICPSLPREFEGAGGRSSRGGMLALEKAVESGILSVYDLALRGIKMRCVPRTPNIDGKCIFCLTGLVFESDADSS